MSESKIEFVKNPSDDIRRLEPSTCTEAETFVLQVLDDSMEPEFRKHCMIVIDPTGLATDGSYVLARRAEDNAIKTDTQGADNQVDDSVEQFHFRQLRKNESDEWQLCSLNSAYTVVPTPADFTEIVGVVVQRAGTRRRYHKRYD